VKPSEGRGVLCTKYLVHRIALGGLLAVVWAGVAAAFAAELAAQGKQERRVVAVNVVDEEGRQVTGLKAENFRGKYRGQEVRVVSAEWDTGPRRVVILLDQSDSMMWGKKLEVVRRAAQELVAAAGPGTEVALVRFSVRPDEVVRFDDGRQAVLNRLAAIEKADKKAGARTAMLDAMMEGLRLLAPGRFGDALFVMTDGGDNASRTRDRDARDAVVCSRARVYFLMFFDPDRTARGAEYATAPGLADEFSKSSGGFVLQPFEYLLTGVGDFELSPEEQADLANRVRLLHGLMAGTYRVEVELPREVEKTRGWELEVVGVDGKKMKGVRVVYPRKVAACGGEKR
jgi:Mg-chelatase subunit ChlD